MYDDLLTPELFEMKLAQWKISTLKPRDQRPSPAVGIKECD